MEQNEKKNGERMREKWKEQKKRGKDMYITSSERQNLQNFDTMTRKNEKKNTSNQNKVVLYAPI